METERFAVKGYVSVWELIDATCHAVEASRNLTVGPWFAERLERAAKIIRERNAELDAEEKDPRRKGGREFL
jgi:hypothetical protein